MARKENEVLASSDIENMITLVEEASRSTEAGVKRFIEPAHGTLRRLTLATCFGPVRRFVLAHPVGR
jgi:hypothetical protein